MTTNSALPVTVSVSSTAKDDHVAYCVKTSMRSSEGVYEVAHRYSEFLAFRTKVEGWTCQEATCAGSCAAIREFLAANFPKKGMSMLKMSPRTVSTREEKLCDVLGFLLECVLLPGNAMKCFEVNDNLPTALFAFLGITGEDDERELLQVFLDNYRVSMASSFSEKTACTICQNAVHPDIESSDSKNAKSPVKLPCGHAFHRSCIREWLLFHFHCPRCHQHPQSKTRVHGIPVSKATHHHHHPHSKASVRGETVSHVSRHHHPQAKVRVHGMSLARVNCSHHPQSKVRVHGGPASHVTCQLHHEARAEVHGEKPREVECSQ